MAPLTSTQTMASNSMDASEVDVSVSTAFGKGTFSEYRDHDETVVIDLPFATLYAARASLEEWNRIDSDSDSQQTFPWDHQAPPTKTRGTMELNHAYESFETMRKLNLELKCQHLGIYPINYEMCTTCLLTSPPPLPPPPPPAPQAPQETGTGMSMFGQGRLFQPNFPRIQKMQQLVKEQRQRITTKQATRCLICATPCCAKHSSKTFRQESLTVCTDCEQVFQLDFVVDCLTDRDKMPEHMERMIDLYDRAVILLKYSSQYIPDVAQQLEGSKERQNKVGVGSSSAGMVSGILGIAAAATIITPAGPPLLIASLLFGGSATAISTGTEARNYYSEPHQLASRIQALHGMVHAILRVTSTLRDAMLRDHIRTDAYDKEDDKDSGAREAAMSALKQHKGKVMAAATAGRFSAAGMETAASVGSTSRFLSRTGSNLLKTVRVARFAGGALSAVVLVFEAKSLNSTIQDIRAGNPCEKAESLRLVHAELETLPTTETVDEETQNYIRAMAQRDRAMTEETVIQLLMEHTGQAVPGVAALASTSEEEESWGQEILPAADEPDVNVPAALVSPATNTSDTSMSSSSLLERIQIHKGKDAQIRKEKDEMSASLMERIQYHKQTKQTGAGSLTLHDEP
jgi:hypothetical protein